ncbi:chemotaxis protein CheW [Thalassolituus pacificus]|uniref:Chemotaxis protein CheW n=1 Tax=Thalassolituus pacificus TaxID=2975440 RepID=A0A9X3AEM7_9GAMM|nr:chemotaxis protein CheW [Thalassolituus pacificus]MCT7357436.1 chemotaxis protein CheW [Thalassolituus pacificus]
MADVTPKTDLANQVDFVLQDYLDQLLVSATDVKPVSTIKSEAAKSEATQSEMMKTEPAVTEEPVPVAVVTEARSLPRFDVQSTVPSLKTAFSDVIPSSPLQEIPEVAVAERVETPSQEHEVAEPGVVDVNELTLSTVKTASLNWQSSQGIDCLIFKVAGLKLAIPLPLLGGVHNVTDKVTPLFGQASWSLGVWQGDKSKLTIIDSAQLIMPERKISLNDDGYSFFIQLDRSPWALACQEICDTVTLVHDSIKWRGEGSKRPWLAGTVISEMCALLDVPGVLKLLEENRRVARRA